MSSLANSIVVSQGKYAQFVIAKDEIQHSLPGSIYAPGAPRINIAATASIGSIEEETSRILLAIPVDVYNILEYCIESLVEDEGALMQVLFYYFISYYPYSTYNSETFFSHPAMAQFKLASIDKYSECAILVNEAAGLRQVMHTLDTMPLYLAACYVKEAVYTYEESKQSSSCK